MQVLGICHGKTAPKGSDRAQKVDVTSGAQNVYLQSITIMSSCFRAKRSKETSNECQRQRMCEAAHYSVCNTLTAKMWVASFLGNVPGLSHPDL